MKKILVLTVLLLGTIFISTAKLGAKMNTNEVSQVRAEHILVLSKTEAENIKAQIENKKITFEEAAKEFSQCPSKENGGDLGYFGRGMMVKEFEQAAFDTPKGTITGPVQTQFGWHLIKVIDKK